MLEPHVHPCPECYEWVPCDMDCTILCYEDKTAVGGFDVCVDCKARAATADQPLPVGATEPGRPAVRVDAAWLSELARGAGTLPTDEFVARFRQMFDAAEAALEERDGTENY